MKIRGAISPTAATLAFLAAQLSTASAFVFTNDTIITPFDTTYDGADIIVSNCTLTVDGPHTFANMLVTPGGMLTHSAAANGQISITVSVLDEPQTLVGTNAVPLANSNVFTASVLVKDLGSTETNLAEAADGSRSIWPQTCLAATSPPMVAAVRAGPERGRS